MAVIVSRSGWSARPPLRDPTPIETPTPRLWVHHTGAEQHGAQGVRDIQRYHQASKGWNDIAYSFLIDDDGTIYEGRGAGVAGAHTEGDNSSSHAACLMGNFDERPPTAEAVASLVWLARHGRDAGWWVPTLGGHRDAPGAQTACPGAHLYPLLPGVRERVAAPPDGGFPMALTDAQQQKLYDHVVGDGRLREVTLLTRALAGVDVEAEVADAVEPGGDARPHLKTLFQGALLDGLREKDDAHPDRGDLREPFKALLREVLAEDDAPSVPPTG
jgi:hypothetical protein